MTQEVIEALVAERRRRGLRQADIAERLGISQQEISKWESGRFLSLSGLQEYAEVLGLQLLLGITKTQYGIRITWKRPVGDKQPRVFAFPDQEMAERFAAIYDPVNAPAQGAKKVELLTRQALEVYGDWEVIDAP